MNVRNLFTDDDAVSPVIGVILMVAITVILAAVIGAFVLNIGGSQDTAPQASFDFGHDGTDATITHAGGGAIDTDTLSLSGDASNTNSDMDFNNVSGDDWTAGETVNSDDTFDDGDTVEVVWSSPNSDKSSIIGTGTAE